MVKDQITSQSDLTAYGIAFGWVAGVSGANTCAVFQACLPVVRNRLQTADDVERYGVVFAEALQGQKYERVNLITREIIPMVLRWAFDSEELKRDLPKLLSLPKLDALFKKSYIGGGLWSTADLVNSHLVDMAAVTSCERVLRDVGAPEVWRTAWRIMVWRYKTGSPQELVKTVKY